MTNRDKVLRTDSDVDTATAIAAAMRLADTTVPGGSAAVMAQLSPADRVAAQTALNALGREHGIRP